MSVALAAVSPPLIRYSNGAWPDDTHERLREVFDTRARGLDGFEATDASATLYDFRALPTDVDASAVRLTDELACLHRTPLATPRAPSLSPGRWRWP